MSDLAQALMVAIRVHADQRDKQGQPYLLHVLRVVGAVSDEAKVVAALHDVTEDGPAEALDWVCSDLIGLSPAEAVAQGLLTRPPALGYGAYIDRMITTPDHAAGRIAREVKIADLRDNLGRIPRCPYGCGDPDAQMVWESDWGSLKRRYEKALATLEAA